MIVAVCIGIFAVAGVAVVALLGMQSRPPRVANRIPPRPSILSPGIGAGAPTLLGTETGVGQDPFIYGGKGVTLSAAEASATVLLPGSDVANPALLSKVWLGPAGAVEGAGAAGDLKEVVLDYVSTGVRIAERPDPSGIPSDARSTFLNEAAAYGLPSTVVETIDGVPGIVLPDVGIGGTVEFFKDGMLVTVLGPHNLSTSELVATADSLS